MTLRRCRSSQESIDLHLNRARTWTRFMLYILGIVFVLASALKLFGMIVHGDALLGSRALLLLVIVAEAGLAIELVFDPHMPRAAFVGLLAFILLASAACVEALAGTTSCACFGPLRINPWYTLAFDLLVCASLLVCGSLLRPRSGFTIVHCALGSRPVVPAFVMFLTCSAFGKGMIVDAAAERLHV
jgi:hypothetical protein